MLKLIYYNLWKYYQPKCLSMAGFIPLHKHKTPSSFTSKDK